MGASEGFHSSLSKGESPLLGIHHITALASDPQRNIDFYVRVLGLRLVKRTVNFDAPDVYHFYYGDGSGAPGTVLTFFPFTDAGRGRRGFGEAGAISFDMPHGSRDYWIHRLSRHGITLHGPDRRFGQEVLSFEDPDGLSIDFTFSGHKPAGQSWTDSPVPAEYRIKGLAGATLIYRDSGETATMLRSLLGFHPAGSEGDRERYHVGADENLVTIDLMHTPNSPPARPGAGSIHHIAWRVPGIDDQRAWHARIEDSGHSVTGIVDRQYFSSIYFHEPGGVLFEIATDVPGFTVDEPMGTLGTMLKLPPWLEQHRGELERVLPPIDSSPAGQAQRQATVQHYI
jgi:catechol 2,3-dioxygenase-like lactoylglutathione lyase family enzyme